MSTNIPTRRGLRNTRLGDENALKTTATAAARNKLPSTSASTSMAVGPSKPLSGTSTAGAPELIAHKRKREALGEVTNKNKGKQLPLGALPQKSKIKGVPISNNVPVRTIKSGPKLPVRRKQTAAADAVVNKAPSEDAMVVDEPAPALRRVSRRALPTTNVSKTVVAAVTTTHVAQIETVVENVIEEEQEPAFKKRRTSSEGNVEADIEVPEETATGSIDVQPVHEDPEQGVKQEKKVSAEDVEGWDDLDADDINDPVMVSEYVNDIFRYLKECEAHTMPDPEYMHHQKELRWSHRGILMDFIIGVHSRFKLLPETLFLTANVIDRFLSLRIVSLSKVQLVGLSSLLIACKFEEICCPSIKDMMNIGGLDDSSEEEMLKAERYILKTLNWGVSNYPQPMNWIRRISKADDYDSMTRTISKFFLEIYLVDRRLLAFKPSLLAAASMWLARLVFGNIGWTPNFIHYSGYFEEEILPVANLMLNYCLRPDKHESFISKYSSKKYQKVAIFVNNWVTSRWTIGEKVCLADELPYLIALAKRENEDEDE